MGKNSEKKLRIVRNREKIGKSRARVKEFIRMNKSTKTKILIASHTPQQTKREYFWSAIIAR